MATIKDFSNEYFMDPEFWKALEIIFKEEFGKVNVKTTENFMHEKIKKVEETKTTYFIDDIKIKMVIGKHNILIYGKYDNNTIFTITINKSDNVVGLKFDRKNGENLTVDDIHFEYVEAIHVKTLYNTYCDYRCNNDRNEIKMDGIIVYLDHDFKIKSFVHHKGERTLNVNPNLILRKEKYSMLECYGYAAGILTQPKTIAESINNFSETLKKVNEIIDTIKQMNNIPFPNEMLTFLATLNQ